MKATNETTTELKKTAQHTFELLKTLRDEIRVELHLAGMEAKKRWETIEPRFAEAELLAAKANQSSHQTMNDILVSYRQFKEWLGGERKGRAPGKN